MYFADFSALFLFFFHKLDIRRTFIRSEVYKRKIFMHFLKRPQGKYPGRRPLRFPVCIRYSLSRPAVFIGFDKNARPETTIYIICSFYQRTSGGRTMSPILLIFSALFVSCDAYFCGVSLPRQKGKRCCGLIPAAFVALAALLLCSFSAIFSSLFTDRAAEILQSAGGILLLFLGGAELLRFSLQVSRYVPEKAGTSPRFREISAISPAAKASGASPLSGWIPAFSAGLAAGTDGAVAALSLIVSGYTASLVIATVTLGHFFAAWLGVRTAKTPAAAAFFEKYAFLPPFFLLFLGATRL